MRTKEQNKEYMKGYRKRNKVTESVTEVTPDVTPPGNKARDLPVDVTPFQAEAYFKGILKERDTEIEALRAEVARLKQALAGRPIKEIHAPMRPTFTGSFSRAAQAKGQMPNRGPLGRMSEDNW